MDEGEGFSIHDACPLSECILVTIFDPAYGSIFPGSVFLHAKLLYSRFTGSKQHMEVMMSRMRSTPGRGIGSACLGMFAILWLGFSIVWMWISYQSNEGWQWLLGIPFVLIGIYLLGKLIYGYLGGVRIGKPELTVSNPSPGLGETFSVSYMQLMRAASEVNNFTLELVFEESATYSQGTDRITEKHEDVVDYYDSPGRRFEAGETFRDHYQFTIPADAMHSFQGHNNKLNWYVRVRVDIAKWHDFTEAFPLQVSARRGW